MKKIVTLATATLLSLLVAGSADALAQRGNTSSGSSTRQSSSSSSSSTRQSSSTSGSSTRQSGSSTRQSGTASTSSSSTRQSGTASTSSSSTRQSGGTSTSRQSGSSTTRQNGGTATSSGSTSRQSTTTTSGSTRQSGSTDSGSSTRQSGTATSSGSSTRQSGTSTSSSSTRQSGTTTSSSSTRQSGTATSSGTSTRQSGTATSSGSSTRQSGTATTGSTTRQTGNSSSRSTASTDLNGGVRVTSASDGTVRSNSNVTKQGLGTAGVAETGNSKPADGGYKADKYGNYRDRAGNYRYGDAGQYRLDDHYNAFRTPPRDRGFIDYGRPGHFYADKPHYFGYRVERLPSRVRLVSYYGINYYLYNGVYYRPYGNTYVICRPPFGTYIDIRVGRGPFNRVRFSYYTNVYRAFEVNAIYLNDRTIAEQNRIIAENNAIIARQNSAIALNSTRANSAYNLASQLGLVQSYAGANLEYFYQDGVFYTVNDGRYQVIIPPAGALVDSLPDDYDVINMGGFELYKVDDTVYRLTLVDGIPYLEVLGQMYGSLANQYNFYGNY